MPGAGSFMLRTEASDWWISSIRSPRELFPPRGWPRDRITCALSPKLMRCGLQSPALSASRYSRYLNMEHPRRHIVDSLPYLAGPNRWSSDTDERSLIYGAVLLSPSMLRPVQ